MKSIKWISKFLTLLVCVSLISCSKSNDGGGGGGGDTFFIPDLSNNWHNKADAENGFFFLNAPAGVNSGTFTGNENVPGITDQDHFSGSFKNHTITFTYDAGSSNGKGGKSYTGTINDASTEITLSSTNGLPALILQK